MMTLVEIKDEVRVHTGISKALKQKFLTLSVETKIPQTVLFNTALSYGLERIQAQPALVATEARTTQLRRKTK